MAMSKSSYNYNRKTFEDSVSWPAIRSLVGGSNRLITLFPGVSDSVQHLSGIESVHSNGGWFSVHFLTWLLFSKKTSMVLPARYVNVPSLVFVGCRARVLVSRRLRCARLVPRLRTSVRHACSIWNTDFQCKWGIMHSRSKIICQKKESIVISSSRMPTVHLPGQMEPFPMESWPRSRMLVRTISWKNWRAINLIMIETCHIYVLSLSKASVSVGRNVRIDTKNQLTPMILSVNRICVIDVSCFNPVRILWFLSDYGSKDPVAEKLLKRANAMPTLTPPEDTSVGSL